MCASRGSPTKVGIWPRRAQVRTLPLEPRGRVAGGSGLRPEAGAFCPRDPRRKSGAWSLRAPEEPCREEPDTQERPRAPATPRCPLGGPRRQLAALTAPGTRAGAPWKPLGWKGGTQTRGPLTRCPRPLGVSPDSRAARPSSRASMGPTGTLGSEVPSPLCPAHAVPGQMRPQITPGPLT